MSYLRVKRVMDFTLSLIAIIVLFPLFVVIAILIKLDSSGPVFFKQTRVGIRKSHFSMLKFRTMYLGVHENTPTELLVDSDKWITRTGKILRKYSLDELPQLFNIIKGEMSIIGPRPALWNQYDLIAEREIYGANNVPVGLTGWAQINGRDELSVELKAKLDGEYSNNISFLFDLKCFFLSIIVVIKTDGNLEGKEKFEYEKNLNHWRK